MSVLIRPIITEKSQAQIATGKYSFQVALRANKIEIAKAIEAMYGVTVANVSLHGILEMVYVYTPGKFKADEKITL